MTAVSNTSPIVYLVKTKRLNLLKDVYEVVYLCSPVWEDIIYLGRRGLLASGELSFINQAKEQEWITLKDPRTEEAVALKYVLVDRGLGAGEASSIALAKEVKAILLANDREAIEMARQHGVETRWFTEILHDALKIGKIMGVEEYIQILDACLRHGLYVSRKQRERAIQEAYQIATYTSFS